MLKLSQTLYAYFQKRAEVACQSARTSKQLLSSCIESANNHVVEVAEEMTVEGAKGRKRSL